MIEREENTSDVFRKKRQTAETLAAEAREADPENAEELKKAALAERVDMLKAQTQQHQKSINVAGAQIQRIEQRLAKLRAELSLPAPTGDDPSVAAYKKRIEWLKEEIKKAEDELRTLTA